MTLVFSMCVIDVAALAAFLVLAWQASGSGSLVGHVQAGTGVWDAVLVASVALELALCASVWRVHIGCGGAEERA